MSEKQRQFTIRCYRALREAGVKFRKGFYAEPDDAADCDVRLPEIKVYRKREAIINALRKAGIVWRDTGKGYLRVNFD